MSKFIPISAVLQEQRMQGLRRERFVKIAGPQGPITVTRKQYEEINQAYKEFQRERLLKSDSADQNTNSSAAG